MPDLPTFEEFLATQGARIGIVSFLVNLLLTAVLALFLTRLYTSLSTSLSNRTLFAKNFLLLAMTTMFIITVVKSSLALSLGLVGALSIVRFRAAIKEPEELAYLFFAIAIGLGMGANQTLLTVVAFVVIALVLWLTKRFLGTKVTPAMSLLISTDTPGSLTLTQVADVLDRYCSGVALRRYDDSDDLLEATFHVVLDDLQKLEASRRELRQLATNLRVSFLDSGESIP